MKQFIPAMYSATSYLISLLSWICKYENSYVVNNEIYTQVSRREKRKTSFQKLHCTTSWCDKLRKTFDGFDTECWLHGICLIFLNKLVVIASQWDLRFQITSYCKHKSSVNIFIHATSYLINFLAVPNSMFWFKAFYAKIWEKIEFLSQSSRTQAKECSQCNKQPLLQ